MLRKDRPNLTPSPCGAAILGASLTNDQVIVNGVWGDIDCLKFPLLPCNRNLSGFGDVFLSPSSDGN